MRDPHAQGVLVEHALQQVLGVLFDAATAFGLGILQVRLADDLAHGRFGAVTNVLLGIAHVEGVLEHVLDLPQHGVLDVDDVLVAGQHQVLGRTRARPAGRGRRVATRAEHDAALVLNVDHHHVADRGGQIVVQAGLDRLPIGLAEDELDRLLVGLDAEEAGGQPDHQCGQNDQSDTLVGAEAARDQVL